MAGTRTSNSIAFLFDLDGTLIDSVYQHVLAWREATQAAGIELPVWRIHRQIGMSGRSCQEVCTWNQAATSCWATRCVRIPLTYGVPA